MTTVPEERDALTGPRKQPPGLSSNGLHLFSCLGADLLLPGYQPPTFSLEWPRHRADILDR